jgi:tRNA dimethylallyltransferase
LNSAESQRSTLPIIFLIGPTAVGKTDFISTLDPRFFEVISADSLQVYRGMDIGTAKPGPELRSRIAHHLLDIVSPREQFQVGDHVRHADAAARGIADRGRLPVVSGGAAYYVKHLLYGLSKAPASTPEARAAVQARLRAGGLAGLFAELTRVDPATAARVGPADEYRITRALEVFETSGRPLSDFPAPTTVRADLHPLLIGLDRPRDELNRRINARVQQMFTAGLRSELESLMAQGFGPGDPGMRGIGYREFFDQDGRLRPVGEDAGIAEEIALHSRQYAKRQMTFFRRIAGITWYPADDVERVMLAIAAFRDSM